MTKKIKFSLAVGLCLVLSAFIFPTVSATFHTVYGYVYLDDELAEGITVNLDFSNKEYYSTTNANGQYSFTIGYDSSLEGKTGIYFIDVSGIIIDNATYTVPNAESDDIINLSIITFNPDDDDDTTPPSDDDDDTFPPSDDDDSTPPASDDDDDTTQPGPTTPTDDDDDDEIITNNVPEIILFTGNLTAKTGEELIYKVKAIDLDGENIKYTFDWADGITNESSIIANATQFNISKKWSNPGKYIISVFATDEINNSNSEKNYLKILVDVLPITDLENNISGYLVDENSDGIYESFYDYSDGKNKDINKENNTYEIDLNFDGEMDYLYNQTAQTGKSLSSDDSQDDTYCNKCCSESGNSIYYLIGIIIVLGLFMLFLIFSKDKNKKNKKQTKKSGKKKK